MTGNDLTEIDLFAYTLYLADNPIGCPPHWLCLDPKIQDKYLHKVKKKFERWKEKEIEHERIRNQIGVRRT